MPSTSLRRLRRRRSASRPSVLDERAVLGELLGQLLDALAAVGLGLDDRDRPVALRREREHAADLAHHRVRQRVIGLVDDDDVRDLHHAGLERLDRVARAGDQHEHDGVGVVDHVDLGLADADRLEEDVVLARRVHQQRRLERGLGQPAERAAGRHRADEDARVEEVLGQPDAVAEQRAAAERRGGVDREHRDLAVVAPAQLDQRADQRRLPGAGRAREADDGGRARVRVDLAHERPALGVVVLDQRDAARQRALVAGEESLGERGLGVRHEAGRSCQGEYDQPAWTPSSNGSGERRFAASPPP